MTESFAARVEYARMIVQRLERLSADSRWSHTASGYRGALIKLLDGLDQRSNVEQTSQDEQALLEYLMDRGFDLLTKAAREIGDPELIRFTSRMSH